MLRSIKLIYDCGEFQDLPEIRYGHVYDEYVLESMDDDKYTFCHRETILRLFKSDLEENFFMFRYLFYCNDYFKLSYFDDGNPKLPVYSYEKLVSLSLNKKQKIFRTPEERMKLIVAD